MILTLLGQVLLSAAIFAAALALVALAAAIAITPGLTPASVLRGWRTRHTARHAMARFDREWARQNTTTNTD